MKGRIKGEVGEKGIDPRERPTGQATAREDNPVSAAQDRAIPIPADPAVRMEQAKG